MITTVSQSKGEHHRSPMTTQSKNMKPVGSQRENSSDEVTIGFRVVARRLHGKLSPPLTGLPYPTD